MSVEICFETYLRSVVDRYKQWWCLYTLTDATGRELQRVEREQIAPAFFDFGMMVQTVQQLEQGRESEQDRDKQEKKEKIERLPVLEGICKYAAEHVLLVGRPGSGKSTALARLLLEESQKAIENRQAKIPVLVELRYLPSEANESSVIERIRAFILTHDPALDLDVSAIENLLRQGRLLLLVDGVNELPSDRGRAQVNQFRELYQKTCPMIFTTRELGGDLGIAKRLEMQPLTEPQMQKFVMAYLPTQGEKLLQQLSGRLREFGQTPLLLWMLCLVFNPSQPIPPNLGMVFRKFIEKVYVGKIKNGITTYRNSQIWWGRLLQCIAFEMISGENLTDSRVAISRQQAERILVEFLKGKVEYSDDCAIRWLNDLLNYHLIQINNDLIEFEHQLIQEYYAAEWLLGLLPSLSDGRLQQVYLNYLKWTEPLALMLELVEGEEQAVRVVRLALEVDLRLGARLAGAVKYGFQEKTINLVSEIEVPQLLKIDLLGMTRSDKAIAYLLPFLSHEDFESRYTVAQAFGGIGSSSVVSALLPNLHDQNSSVRLATIKSLEKIPSEISVLELIAALQEPLADIRRSAASALGSIGIHTAGDALLESLNDKDSSVRREAAASLGKIGGSKALLGLINLLGDRGFHVAVTAAYAIAEIDTSDVNEVDILKAVDELTKFALKTDENEFLVAAISALKALNYEAIPDLILLNIDNEHSLVRANAAYALGELGDQEIVPILLNLLIDENNLVKAKAISALGKLSATEATSQLLNMFPNEKDGYIRACIVSTLGRFHVEESVNLLINSLDDPESNVRESAAYALGKIHTNEAIQGILTALKHKDVWVRRNAITAIKLGKLKTDIFVQAISNMLNDEDEWVRAYACEALGVIGNKSDITNILAALQDSIPTVRRGAIRALREMRIDTKEVAEKVSSLLTDTDIHVRQDASYAFREIACPKYLNNLFELQQSTGEIHLFSTITAIQARCKYYNYKITMASVPREPSNIMENKMIDFAIITALKIERLAVLKAFGIDEDRDRVQKGTHTYWRKCLPLKDDKFYEIVVAQCPDMANVNSALLTNDTLHHWKPQAVIMVGIAATAKSEEKQHLGDLVIGKEVYYYEMGKKTANGKIPEPKQIPVDATLLDRVQSLPDKAFSILAIRPDGTATSPNVEIGVIASGDKVIADANERDEIAASNRKILAIEMEGYGVISAASQDFDRPRCLVIRGLCDFADATKNDEWHHYAAAVAAGYTKKFLLDMPLAPLNFAGDKPTPTPTTGNTYIFHNKVGQVVGGNLTVHGDNIATQNNQKTVPES